MKEKDISERIKSLEEQLARINAAKMRQNEDADADTLDSYMKELSDPKLDKYEVAKLKVRDKVIVIFS